MLVKRVLGAIPEAARLGPEACSSSTLRGGDEDADSSSETDVHRKMSFIKEMSQRLGVGKVPSSRQRTGVLTAPRKAGKAWDAVGAAFANGFQQVLFAQTHTLRILLG